MAGHIEYGVITPLLPEKASEAALRFDKYDPLAIMAIQQRLYPDLVGGYVHETAVSPKGIWARAHERVGDP